MIRHLLASERIAVPWKNGGGVTREVAVCPQGADMDTFLWRVSMAEVTEAGPFSCFEGIDRHLTVLRGSLQLNLAGKRLRLNPLDSLAFAGDVPVLGAPIEGPVTDLNIMVRRGQVRAQTRQVFGPVETDAPTALLIDLATLDAILIEQEGYVRDPSPSILIEFYSATAS